ncbi:hypothetical protein Leryth_005840 [Lithospermum erythrorhizon]|nr:hypothetical protein Leryth_005840 [Lithospermum erythrorhizon]
MRQSWRDFKQHVIPRKYCFSLSDFVGFQDEQRKIMESIVLGDLVFNINDFCHDDHIYKIKLQPSDSYEDHYFKAKCEDHDFHLGEIAKMTLIEGRRVELEMKLDIELQGLPLAIVVIAGLLSKEKNPN